MEEATSFGNVFHQSSVQNEPQKKRSWKKAVVLLFLLILLGFGGYTGMSRLLGGGAKQVEKAQITPTPTVEEQPTDTPTPEESPTPKATKTPNTPTPRPTTSPIDQATGLDRREISIEVQNGSGVAGVAGKVADFLKSFGYKISGTSNADTFDHTNVSISVKSASANYLPLLKSDLSSQYTIGDTDSSLSASSSADAVVIVGK